jgi:hypothetical protein
LFPIVTRWSRCQLTAGRGQKFIPKVALFAPRRVASSRASIRAAETLAQKRRLLSCMARVSIHAIQSFLTITTSSQLPLPVPASIPRAFFSFVPPVVHSSHHLDAGSWRAFRAKQVPDPLSSTKSGSYATEDPSTPKPNIRRFDENTMSFLSNIDTVFATSRLNGCAKRAAAREGSPREADSDWVDCCASASAVRGGVNGWGGHLPQRASLMVNRAPVSPGRLLARASPR